jgi:hypothetical protein
VEGKDEEESDDVRQLGHLGSRGRTGTIIRFSSCSFLLTFFSGESYPVLCAQRTAEVEDLLCSRESAARPLGFLCFIYM